jgi:hypothetical protein
VNKIYKLIDHISGIMPYITKYLLETKREDIIASLKKSGGFYEK